MQPHVQMIPPPPAQQQEKIMTKPVHLIPGMCTPLQIVKFTKLIRTRDRKALIEVISLAMFYHAQTTLFMISMLTSSQHEKQ
uniref:Uncharacterized protein n=1 Tax=Rhizophora mucronata TaxID=61149 RepID=A0A2P2PK81_RHIMU